MNKLFKYINLFLICLNLGILIFYYQPFNLSFGLLLLILMSIVIILNVYCLIKKREIISKNNYKLIFLGVSFVTLIILARDLFDTMIILGSSYRSSFFSMASGATSYPGSYYFSNNLIFLLILYGCLLIYNFINIKNKGAK